MATFLTSAYHPNDPVYRAKRQSIVHGDMRTWTFQETEQAWLHAIAQPAPENAKSMTQAILRDMRGQQLPAIAKGILDSTAGTGGNVLIRQDLEPYLYRLFVTKFPAWERIKKDMANGLTHAYNQITAPDGAALGSSIISELGTVSYQSSSYNRAYANIAVFATGRGASIKEQAAVQAGGMAYNVLATEMGNGMTRLSADLQYTLFTGDSTTSAGAGAATELGLYNANAFDGLRSQLGSVGSYTTNNAIQIDQGTLNMLESLQQVATRGADAGGMPDLILLSMRAKQALDEEQQAQRWYTDTKNEIVPGLISHRIQAANGMLELIPVPGNTMGTYNRTSDGALVEDMYVLQSDSLVARYLFSDSFTVLEIPAGVDSVLSNRYIIFGMWGLEVATPPFMGKVRRLYS